MRLALPLKGCLLLFSLSALFTGCAQKTIPEKSIAITAAERLEQRASNAYSKGDLVGAAKDFQTAILIYDSIAMVNAAASAQLSLARIDSEEGRTKNALEHINNVLRLSQQRDSAIHMSVTLLANGRAAALYLQQNDTTAANNALTAAERLCVNTCDARSALLTLRSHWALVMGDADGAKIKAANALVQSNHANDKANALRSLAEANLALGQLKVAADNAEQALQTDRAQGHSQRIIADLKLLARIYAKAENSEKSAAYLAQSQAASRAHQQLSSKHGAP